MNANYLRFDKTGIAQDPALPDRDPTSPSASTWGVGVLYRPLLNENVVITAGITGLLAGQGLRRHLLVVDLRCGRVRRPSSRKLFNAFVQREADVLTREESEGWRRVARCAVRSLLVLCAARRWRLRAPGPLLAAGSPRLRPRLSGQIARKRPTARAPAASPATPRRDAKTMHASPSVTLGCTDCHGGDATREGGGHAGIEAVRGRAAPGPRASRRTAEIWKSVGQPRAVLHGAPRGEPGLRPLREPGRPAGRPHVLRLPATSERGHATSPRA